MGFQLNLTLTCVLGFVSEHISFTSFVKIPKEGT